MFGNVKKGFYICGVGAGFWCPFFAGNLAISCSSVFFLNKFYYKYLMIEYIKADCPLNSEIVIEFEDKVYVGVLIYIDDKLLRLETSHNGLVLLAAKKLDSLLSYHINDSANDNDNDNEESNANKKIKNDDEEYSNTVTKEPASLRKLYEEYNATSYAFPKIDFTLLVSKADKFSSDEETYEVYQQLQRILSKYKYALTLNVEKNKIDKFQEIESILSTLLSNHYFNDDLRYNIAFINYELNNIDKAIALLSQVPNMENKSNFLIFISFLYFEKGNTEKCIFYYDKYFKLSQKTDTEFYFFLNLIERLKIFSLLNSLLESVETMKVYLVSLVFLKKFEFSREYNEQINKF
ncbi:MAG: hypothetical protein JJT94_00615, partial [Bernardetiaceae bacterium]|nr:hypothetical protein [Bernardetiaceae bacterium]